MNDNDSDNSNESINNIDNKEYDSYIEKKYINNIFKGINYYKDDKNDKITLFEAIKNNMRGIKTVYYSLLCIQILELEFRNKCKCCIPQEYTLFLKEFETNNTFIPDNYKINFIMKKFLKVIDMLSCECKFKESKEFYKANFMNFKDMVHIYLQTIPTIIELLITNYKITYNNEKFKLLSEKRCIHEDIRNNNIIYCKHKEYTVFNKKIIKELVLNLIPLNLWILNNIKITKKLFSEQSFNYYKNLKNKNDLESFKKIYVKQFYVIDINYKKEEQSIINILLSSNIEFVILKNIFKLIINEIKKHKINEYLFDYFLLAIQYNKLELCVDLCNYLEISDNYEKYKNHIKILNDKILNSNIQNYEKMTFIKILQKKNIYYLNLLKIFDYSCAEDLIIILNDNNIIIDYNNYEEIINLCIKHNKYNIFNYVLEKYNKKIKNPYINYFTHIKNDYIDYKLLKIITNYNYNINVKINIIFNKIDDNDGNLDLLYYCILNNYNLSAKILIENKISLISKYDDKTLLIHCIDNHNYNIGKMVINNDPSQINIVYKNIKPLNYLFANMKNENKIIFFVKEFLLSKDFDINYQDEYNRAISFELLSLKNKKYKIALFNIICTFINAEIKFNNIPLILSSLLLDEYEITYILLQNLIKNKKIKNDLNYKNTIYEYKIMNNEINYIPIIFKYIQNNTQNIIYANNIENYNFKNMIVNDIIFYILYLSILLLNNYKNNNKTKIIVNKEIKNENINIINEEDGYKELTENDDMWINNNIIIEPNKLENNSSSNIESVNNSYNSDNLKKSDNSEISETEICFSSSII